MPARPRACCLSGITLDREVDVSRGDWIIAAPAAAVAEDDFDAPAAAAPGPASREITATVAWMDNEPLVPGRVYWALHGHRWVKAKARRVVHRLNINTWTRKTPSSSRPTPSARWSWCCRKPFLPPFTQARQLGSLILVDTASNATAGAALVN
jgi:sulfate adenylyltransferase subunit 1